MQFRVGIACACMSPTLRTGVRCRSAKTFVHMPMSLARRFYRTGTTIRSQMNETIQIRHSFRGAISNNFAETVSIRTRCPGTGIDA